MNSVKSIGQLGQYNWDQLLAVVKTQEGKTITTDPSLWNLDNPSYKQIYSMWEKANFNMNTIKWTNYYPGEHFDKDMMFCNTFAKHREKKLLRAWVSRVDPGYMAPWHWDVDDNEEEYLKNGTITRYSVFLQGAKHGHIFIVGNDYLYNREMFEAIEWNNYRDWHSGINAGLEPKYMFHLLAFSRAS